ncbi:MAG: DinB family protein [Bryobacterales bacterium]|nr:DinB family protein [Bryobacterales bacterium]
MRGMLRGAVVSLLLCGAAGAETIAERDRAYLVSHLEMTREFVVDATAHLRKEQWLFQPGARRWSTAQCIDHLARTEEEVLRLVRERVLPSKEPLLGAFASMTKGRKAAETPPKRMGRREDSYIMRWMTDRTQVAGVPAERRPPIEEVAPRQTIADPQSALDHFLRARAETIAFVKATQEDLRGHFVQAPMEGVAEMPYTDAYQWMLRLSMHVERHLMQVHEVRRSAGYPGRR